MKRILTLLFIVLYHASFSQTWKSLASISTSVNFGRTASFSIGGKGYVFGGSYQTKAYSYDTLTDTWTKITDYPAGTTDGVVACSLNGIGYAGTGVQYSSFTNNFFKYDPNAGAGGTWTALPNFPGAARAYAVMFALDGKVYLGGGISNGGTATYTDFYAYDPVTNLWGTALAPCPALGVSCDAVAFVVGGKAYVGTGGKIVYPASVPQKDFYEYDTTSKAWSPVASLPGRERAEASAFATCDKGYVGLGYINAARDTDAVDFWQYDPAKDIWVQIADLTGGARNGACSFSIGKTGYVFAGLVTGYGSYYYDLWSYTATAIPAFSTAGASSTTICAGQSVTFKDTSNYTPDNWKWSFQGGTPDTSNLPNPVITYNTPGTFDVTLTAYNDCDSATKRMTKYITVGTAATINVTVNPPTICAGQSTTLSVVGSSTYAWSPSTGLTVTTGSSITASPTVTTTYTVTDLNGACNGMGQGVVQIGGKGSAGTISALRDTICSGTAASLKVTGNSGNVQWQSSVTPNSFLDISGATDTTLFDIPAKTIYYRDYVGGSCSDTTLPYKIIVKQSPVAKYGYTASGTGGLHVTFNSDSSTGATIFDWDFGDGATANGVANPIHDYPRSDTFKVCLTVYNGSNCSFQLCRNIRIGTTGVAVIAALANWSIYPNPANEQLAISCEHIVAGSEIEIKDVLGRTLHQQPVITNQTIINISYLPEGIYFAALKNKDGNEEVKKFVKE